MYGPDLSPAMGSTLVENRETVTELFDDHYIDVGTFRTRFWKAGNSGSTVVLLAGIGCTVLEWQKNVAALASRHRVYAFEARLPRSKKIIFDECGHLPQLEQAQRFNAAVLEFLESVE